ncbi:hypothetical protein ACN28G_29055 [Micromonospora sp. WMMA1923]|uniref:hypothetical protein n=1 Tax=Micromonospora sp. WMMA1923 TaxID=3404125 RepID=UPI003B94FC27
MTAEAGQRFGTGPLARAAALVHTLLVVEVLLLVGTLPGLLPLVLLGHDASNLPLLAACLVPAGPALAAALFTLRHQRLDLTELRPAALFRRGYRVNLLPVLRIWVPMLVWLAVIGVNLANLRAAGVPSWWAVLLVIVALAVTLVGANALLVTALFRFRARDVLRLAGYFLTRTPSVPVGTLVLLAAAAGITAVFSEAVLVLLGAPFVLAFLRIGEPMIDKIQKEFTT